MTTAALATGGAGSAASATQAPAQGLPPANPVSPEIYVPRSQTVPPPGFFISARTAVRLAERTRAYQKARAKHPDIRGTAYISPLPLASGTFYHWEVHFTAGKKALVEVDMSTAGLVLEVQTAPDVGWNLLRGYPGVLGQRLNAPYVWLPLCLVFLLPFFDPRRPLRLLHLDLVMLLAFGISQIYFSDGRPDISVPLVYPFLVYVIARMLIAALRPARRRGSLIPYVSTRALVAGVVVLLAFRAVLGFTDSRLFDLSTAGVVGAQRILHGLPLYVQNDYHGDTYGPVNYLAYVPFELVFPFNEAHGARPAARTATVSFDLLVVISLFVLGRRLRPGPDGNRMGAALAFAWVAYPYTSLVIESVTNDALVPLFLIWALILLRSPPARGLLAAIAGLTKFSPFAVLPVIATGRGPFRWRPVLTVAAAATAFTVALIWAFLPEHGLSEFWNTTLGFQIHRTSPLSLWVRDPSLDWLRTVCEVFAVGIAIGAAFVPSRRTIGQIAALCAAILAAIQIPANYWIYFYLVWFAPFFVIALFEEYPVLAAGRRAQERVSKAFVNPLSRSQPPSVTTTRSSILTPNDPGM